MSNELLAQAMRDACLTIRTKSMPLADLIPMMQKAADALAAVPVEPSAYIINDAKNPSRYGTLVHAHNIGSYQRAALTRQPLYLTQQADTPGLAKLVLELAEAVDNAVDDIGGSRPQLDILRDAVKVASATHPAPQRQQADSTEGLRKMLDVMNFSDSARWEIGFRNIVAALYGPKHSFEIADVVAHVRRLAAAPPQPTAPAPQAQAVPAGFSLRRQEDGRIVVKAPIGWCIVANTGQASGIDSMILWSLADAMLAASAAQKEPTCP